MTDQDNSNITENSIVILREVTKENLREILNLEVAPDQKKFVAPNAVSIAQAYFDREIAWFRAIYADETPVGFVMMVDNPSESEYYLWRYMIDARYQGFGFGWRALELVVEYVKTRPNAKEFFTSCVPGDDGPYKFYEKFGFKPTGEMEDDEIVMRLAL